LNLLLDTHIILWSAAEPARLPLNMADALKSPDNTLWFSPISIWEILMLVEKGRISVKGDHQKTIRTLFETLPLNEAVLNREVAIQSRYVDLPHQDPADRFLAATAMVYNLTLVTADRRLLRAKNFQVLGMSA